MADALETPVSQDHVVDACDYQLFRAISPAEALDTFQANWGHRPRSMALPISSHAGTPFSVPNVPYSAIVHAKTEFGWTTFVSKIRDVGCDLYLVLKPDMKALGKIDWFVLKDLRGITSNQLCFGNPNVIEIWRSVIRSAVTSLSDEQLASVRGLVIDVVDLWPLGAEDNRIIPTCFCGHCQSFLATHQVAMSELEGFPSPWNLALRDTGSGLGFISDFDWNTELEQIVRMGVGRRFWDADKLGASLPNNPERLAESLRLYMRARHEQTVQGLASLFDEFQHQIPAGKRVVVMELEGYGWTSGLFRDRLDESKCVDEIWTSPGSFIPTNVTLRPYMWRRSRYFVDAFFDLLWSTTDQHSLFGTSLGRRNIQGMLALRWAQLMSAAAIGQEILAYLPDEAWRKGAVGPALDMRTGDRLGVAMPQQTSIGQLQRLAGEGVAKE